MKNIYYLYWADSIYRIKRYKPQKNNWKFTIYTLNTFINAFNLWFIIIWLKYFKILTIPSINIDFFPGQIIDSFLSFSLEFALPFGIMNYFLIFYRDRYKKIIGRYQEPEKMYAYIYSVTVVLAAFITAILYGVLM